MTFDYETKEVSYDLAQTWEEFQATNDQRLKEVEKKGASDVLHTDKLEKMDAAIETLQTKLRDVTAALYRPAAGEPMQVKDNALVHEHKRAFTDYLRKGVDSGLSGLETKALSGSVDTDGGYMLTTTMSQYIAKVLFDTSPMRQIARVETISSDGLEIIEDYNEASVGWTSETATVVETNTPGIGKRVIPCHTLYAQPRATQKIIDDAAINIEQWLADKIADKITRTENTAFIAGSGVGQPRGITTYPAGTSFGQIQQLNTGVASEVTADALLSLLYTLKESYAARARFLMHRSTLQKVRLLKETSTGQYLWTPYLGAGQPETLLGLPVHSAVDMPTPASGSLSIALGDFGAAYQIVDRDGIRILRDPFTAKPYVIFYTTKRVGGDVINFDAIKLLKLS